MMGARQSYLNTIMQEFYGIGHHKKPKSNEFYSSDYNSEIDKIYMSLGGQFAKYPTDYRGFDLQCRDFIVELDEERHFNRYRHITLKSDFYNTYDYFNVEEYKTLCKNREKECLAAASWGGNWKTDSSEKQFGKSNIEGCLDGSGSSRWKQRAFYDFLRDVSSYLFKIPVIRISIWEKTDNHLIFDDLLRCNNVMLIKEFITGRVKNFIGR